MRLTICNRLLKDLSAPMLLDGHALTLTASIGISIFPDHGETSDLLLRNADMALVEAKRAGRGQAQIYSPRLGRQQPAGSGDGGCAGRGGYPGVSSAWPTSRSTP